MPKSTRTEGLTAYRNTLLKRFPQAAREEMRKANHKSADDFADLLGRVIVKGDPARGHLADTIRKDESGGSDIAAAVSIGDAAHPYPLHLELGHRAADGSQVAGKPAIIPARRIVAKRHKGRVSRALSKAIKSITGAR